MDSVTVEIRETAIDVAVQVGKTVTEFDKEYSKEYYQERYRDREKLIIVGYVKDRPAGFIVAFDRDQDGSFYCWMAGVNPGYRGNGVLKSLMDYLFDWAKKRGYTKIKIKTRNNRREMLSYLVKYGFLFTDVVPEKNIQHNRICLEKKL